MVDKPNRFFYISEYNDWFVKPIRRLKIWKPDNPTIMYA